MILIKFQLWRQEDTRSVFLKKMKEFWEKNKKNKENLKNIKKNKFVFDMKNGVVKRKIKDQKNKNEFRYNVIGRMKMVSLRKNKKK